MESLFPGLHLLNRETHPLFNAFLVAWVPHPSLEPTVSSFPKGKGQIWLQIIEKNMKQRFLNVSSILFSERRSGLFWFCGSPKGSQPCLLSAFSPRFPPVWWTRDGEEGQVPRRPRGWPVRRRCHWLLLTAPPATGGFQGRGKYGHSRWSPHD